jgi:chromate transporter
LLDGLGLAETTPGPLIQVVQFVGFLAAWRQPAPFDPTTAAILGSVVTTWVTFAPCFLWIFLGAPWIDGLLARPRLSGALAGVGAAVVGAVLNLSLWFALHALFGRVETMQAGPLRVIVPDPATLDPVALGLAVAALVLLTRLRLGLLATLGLVAAAGAVIAVL